MNLLALYPDLVGSTGAFRLQLDQPFLEALCDLLRPLLPSSVSDIRISASGTNRFRMNAKLSSQALNVVGKPFLNILAGNGLEVNITRPVVARGALLEGRLETTLVGKQVVDYIIKALNQALGNEVVRSSSGWFSGGVELTLDPFPILKRFLPGGIGNDISQLQWQTTAEAFFIDLVWIHQGANPTEQPKGSPMSPAMQEFVDKLVRTQFADLKGSYAEMSLQLSENLLNEMMSLALSSQQESNPLLSLVKTAKINGSLTAQFTVRA